MKRAVVAALVLAFGAVGLTGCELPVNQKERQFKACIEAGGSWVTHTFRSAECILPDYEGDAK